MWTNEQPTKDRVTLIYPLSNTIKKKKNLVIDSVW